jgi:hypothetical protein
MEIVLVMSLVGLLAAILLGTVARVARLSRQTSYAALRRKHWIDAAELMRWQLRNLHQPSDRLPPENSGRPGLVGSFQTALWGEPGSQEGMDQVFFLTTLPRRARGTSEVGYCMRPRGEGGTVFNLMYRQFPLRDRSGLHGLQDAQEAPWRVLLDKVTHLSLDYSEDGWTWRRDWSETKAPRRIRVHLEAEQVPVLDFQVTPGVGGGRW